MAGSKGGRSSAQTCRKMSLRVTKPSAAAERTLSQGDAAGGRSAQTPLPAGCRLDALRRVSISPLANEGLLFPEAVPGLRPCPVKRPCVCAAGSFPSPLAREVLGAAGASDSVLCVSGGFGGRPHPGELGSPSRGSAVPAWRQRAGQPPSPGEREDERRHGPSPDGSLRGGGSGDGIPVTAVCHRPGCHPQDDSPL